MRGSIVLTNSAYRPGTSPSTGAGRCAGARRDVGAERRDAGLAEANVLRGTIGPQLRFVGARAHDHAVDVGDHLPEVGAELLDLARPAIVRVGERNEVVAEHHHGAARVFLQGLEGARIEVGPGRSDRDQGVARGKRDQPLVRGVKRDIGAPRPVRSEERGAVLFRHEAGLETLCGRAQRFGPAVVANPLQRGEQSPPGLGEPFGDRHGQARMAAPCLRAGAASPGVDERAIGDQRLDPAVGDLAKPSQLRIEHRKMDVRQARRAHCAKA